MAKKSSPTASFRSGTRSSPASPNYFIPTSPSHSLPASPSHLEPKDGLTVLRYASAVRNRVLIANDATKDPSETCLVWALYNLIRPGDSVTILGILHRINNPMGYKSQANLSAFVGTNKVALELEMSEKLVHFENHFREFADLCDRRGVYLDITITAGTPLKSVLVKEATKMKMTHVLLDRHLRRDKRYYKEHLQCDVVAFSEKNQAERVREGSISCIFDNPGLPLQKPYSAASSSMPVSPTSSATSYTFDGSSDTSISKGESRASMQSFVGGREDVSLRCLPEVKPNDKTMSEDLADLSAGSGEQSMASSPAHSRENSFIDLFMLSSPDGITPVWSSVNKNEIGSSPGRVNCAEQAEAKAELISSPGKVIMASSVEDVGCEQPSTDLALSTSFSSDQQLSVTSQKDIVSVQPRRHLPQLSELMRAHECQPGSDVCKNGAEGSPEDIPVPAPSKGEEAQPLQNSVSNVMVDDIEEKHMPHNLTKTEDKECVLRKHLTQAPPLCSICNITSLELGRSPRIYDWLELKAATNNFASENLVAEGGFSFVYKGTLPEGQIVAIKKLKALSVQGEQQFAAEVEALSCAQHRNLVRLLGYGVGSSERALVYEYVCNGSLDQHLSGHIGGLLEWASRYKIAIGAARGLRYLHEECRVGCIVHRDLRPNNILITHDFVSMVGDFGLAKLNTNVDAAIETQVIGALGFLAPEYVECGQVTSKTDVYSFGVVLLELISGRKAIDLQRPKGEISLVEWARQKLQNHLVYELVDQKVADSLDMFELDRMVKAASLCIKRDPQARPGMSQVLRILEGDSYELSIENMEEIFSNSFTKAGYKSDNIDYFHHPVDRLPHSTSKRVSAAPKGWRYFVKSS